MLLNIVIECKSLSYLVITYILKVSHYKLKIIRKNTFELNFYIFDS